MDGSQVKQMIATLNIVKGRLMMRVQTAYVVPPVRTRESRLYLANKNHLKCPHSHSYSLNNRRLALKIVNKFETLETLPEGCQEVLLSSECAICFTKFYVGLRRFIGEGTMLFIMKVQHLGTGLSPMESDMPRVVGPKDFVPFQGMGQRLLLEPLQLRDEDLDPSFNLTQKKEKTYLGEVIQEMRRPKDPMTPSIGDGGDVIQFFHISFGNSINIQSHRCVRINLKSWCLVWWLAILEAHTYTGEAD